MSISYTYVNQAVLGCPSVNAAMFLTQLSGWMSYMRHFNMRVYVIHSLVSSSEMIFAYSIFYTIHVCLFVSVCECASFKTLTILWHLSAVVLGDKFTQTGWRLVDHTNSSGTDTSSHWKDNSLSVTSTVNRTNILYIVLLIKTENVCVRSICSSPYVKNRCGY